jgi:hypothetical protein
MMMMLLTSALSKAGSDTVADLPAELRDALVHDAACAQTALATGTEPAEFLKSSVQIQEIRSATRGLVGSIVTFADSCHCHDANCRTYVYLLTGTTYKLAVTGSFASFHPMRVSKRGFPSLTAKFQVSDSVAETTVYDWNGKSYEPALCATVRQAGNQKRPSILRHECPDESRSR